MTQAATMTEQDLVRHARKMREQYTLPNGVGNTIDALCDALQGSAALPGEAITEEMRDEAYREAKLCDGDHASTAFEYGWDAAVAAMRAATPTAPVQDDDAWLRKMAAWLRKRTCDDEINRQYQLIADALERAASRLSPTPDTGLIEAKPLNMCAHGADRGSYCGHCGGYSQGGSGD